MESIRSFLDAVGTFLDHLSEVHWNALLIAICFHCANLLLRSRAWCSIVRAAFPRERMQFRIVLGAYLAGVGINAFAPARGGDVVKIATVRHRVEGSNVPALTSSLLAETVFDFFVATALLAWAYATSRLPHLPDIPDRAGLRVVVHRPPRARHADRGRRGGDRRLAAAAVARPPRARLLAARRAGRRHPPHAAPLPALRGEPARRSAGAAGCRPRTSCWRPSASTPPSRTRCSSWWSARSRRCCRSPRAAPARSRRCS